MYCFQFQVYERLQKLCITVSHKSMIHLLDDVGKDFDRVVCEWRDSFIPLLGVNEVTQSNLNV